MDLNQIKDLINKFIVKLVAILKSNYQVAILIVIIVVIVLFTYYYSQSYRVNKLITYISKSLDRNSDRKQINFCRMSNNNEYYSKKTFSYIQRL